MAWRLYFANVRITHKEIAKELKMAEKTVIAAICERGVRQRDIIQREKDKWFLKHRNTFTLDRENQIERCVQCQIFMINREDIVPPEWAWDINGRLGDICRACGKEMNVRQKKRMNELVRVGCIVCRVELGVYTTPEIHHLRDRLGVGQRKNHDRTIPLCPEHHRLGGYGIARHGSLQEWEKRHGTEAELLDMVNTVLEMMLQ